MDLAEPRLVTVEVSGPQAQRQALATSTTQLWLLPGKHIEGDGLIVELPGFVVDVLAPPAHEFLKLAADKKLQALVKHNGQPLTQLPLKYAGKTSTFQGELSVQHKGAYEITVTAFDPATGNTGVDRTTFLVE